MRYLLLAFCYLQKSLLQFLVKLISLLFDRFELVTLRISFEFLKFRGMFGLIFAKLFQFALNISKFHFEISLLDVERYIHQFVLDLISPRYSIF